MTTPILAINELANNQVNQFITANEAFRALESAMRGFLLLDFSTGNISLTQSDLGSAFLFRATANTLVRNLEIPAVSGFFAVQNLGSATLNIIRGSTSLELAAGQIKLYFSDGSVNGLVVF